MSSARKISYSTNHLQNTFERKKLGILIASLGIVSIFVISGIFVVPRTYAFANGQNASIVIGQTNFTSSNSSTSPTGLSTPTGIAFDSSGDLWVADMANNRVLEFKAPLSTGEAASIVLGKDNFTISSDVCSDTTSINPSCLTSPTGLAFDSSGNLWVSDSGNNRILEFTPPFIDGENASMVIGMANFTTGSNPLLSQTPSQSDVDLPGGLTFDSSGNLWVADTLFNRVLEFNAPFSIGESASTVIGQDNFTSGTTANYPGCAAGYACPSASSLQGPTAVKFDSSGNLWISDSTPNRILKFSSPFSNGESASLVLGEPNFTTYQANQLCVDATNQFCMQPTYFTFDNSGKMWVSDEGWGERVIGFNPPFTNEENASIVLGEPDFSSGTGVSNATVSTMATPEGIAIDSSGNVWVADSHNNRILEFLASVASSSTTPSISATSSTSSSTTTTSLASSTLTSVPSSSSTQIPTSVTTSSTTTTSSVSSSSTSISLNYLEVVGVVSVIMIATLLVVRKRQSSS